MNSRPEWYIHCKIFITHLYFLRLKRETFRGFIYKLLRNGFTGLAHELNWVWHLCSRLYYSRHGKALTCLLTSVLRGGIWMRYVIGPKMCRVPPAPSSPDWSSGSLPAGYRDTKPTQEQDEHNTTLWHWQAMLSPGGSFKEMDLGSALILSMT